MYLTHSILNYATDITLINYVKYPQYIHAIIKESSLVEKGIRHITEQIVNNTLDKNNITETIKTISNIPCARIGFILAAGNTVWGGQCPNVQFSDKYPKYKVPPLVTAQIYAGKLANSLGNFQRITTDATSCISGHSAWFLANMLLEHNMLDAVVVLAVENATSEEHMTIFTEYGIIKKLDEEDNPIIQKIRLGQGCHIGVFQSAKFLETTKDIPLAKINNISITAESHNNPLGISAEGTGFYKAIMQILDNTNYAFIKTHSTRTSENEVENFIINKIFDNIRTVDYKLRIGHTMGASTALETALAIKEEKGNFISLGAGMGNVFSACSVEILK